MKKIPLPHFSELPLSEEQRSRLPGQIKPMNFAKGESVFSQGEVCRRLYYLRSGMVKLSYTTLDGKEMIKSFITEGEIFGSLHSQITRGESTFSAIALEPLQVDALDYTILQQMINENPELQKLMLHFFQQLALKKEIREYEFLCFSAAQRYQKLCDENPDLIDRVKQADLALYLGITPIALSRLKHREEK